MSFKVESDKKALENLSIIHFGKGSCRLDPFFCASSSSTMSNDSGVHSMNECGSPVMLTKCTKDSSDLKNSGAQKGPGRRSGSGKHTSSCRQGPQQCLVCGKIFSNASALTKHKLTHSDERKHACSICGKAFKRQDHLNGHMLTHRNKKPFECIANGCGKSYCDARSLRRHMESRHSGLCITNAENSTESSVLNFETCHSLASCRLESAEANSQPSGFDTKKHKKKSEDKARSTLIEKETVPGIKMDINYNDYSSIISRKEENGNSVISTDLITYSDCCEELIKFPAYVFQPQKQSWAKSELETRKKVNNVEGKVVEKQDMEIKSSKTSSISAQGIKELGEQVKDLIRITVDSFGEAKNNISDSETRSSLQQQNCDTGPNLNGVPQVEQKLEQLFISKCLEYASLKNGQSSLKEQIDIIQKILLQAQLENVKQNNQKLDSIANNSKDSFTVASNSFQSNGTPDAQKPLTRTLDEVILCSDWSKTSNSGGKDHIQDSECENEELFKNTIYHCGVPGADSSRGSISSSCSSPISPSSEKLDRTVRTTGRTASSNISALTSFSDYCDTSLNEDCSEDIDQEDHNVEGDGDGNMRSYEGPNDCKTGNDKPPVQCTICCRKFKNTPALNGHMRLHGGYFKKDVESKKKEQSPKESCSPPLQTASSSVRALIEEKIIQKRINSSFNALGSTRTGAGLRSEYSSNDLIGSGNSNGICSKKLEGTKLAVLNKVAENLSRLANNSSIEYCHPNSEDTKGNECAESLTLKSDSEEDNCIDGKASKDEDYSPTNLPLSCITLNALSNDSEDDCGFQLSNGQNDGNSFLLMEEDVFNKVSTICPDSFLAGIEESILNSGTVDGSNHVDWSWIPNPTNAAAIHTPNGNGNTVIPSHILDADGKNNMHLINTVVPLDSVYYNPTPTTPRSPMNPNSQPNGLPINGNNGGLDSSTSFMYPTPPSSLESYSSNANQSPMFQFNVSQNSNNLLNGAPSNNASFHFTTNNSTTIPGSASSASLMDQNVVGTTNFTSSGATSYFKIEPITSKGILTSSAGNYRINSGSPVSSNTVPVNSVNPGLTLNVTKGLSTSGTHENNNIDASASTFVPSPATSSQTLKQQTKQISQVKSKPGRKPKPLGETKKSTSSKARNKSGGSNPPELSILTPSSSPSIASSGTEDSVQSFKELKFSDGPSKDTTNCDEFVSPKSVVKVGRRKAHQLRNTFASNLRPQACVADSPHYTPHPILSPVRSAPGLYWSIAGSLSHIDNSRKAAPKINIGKEFQANIPDLIASKAHQNIAEKGDLLWNPQVMDNCTLEHVDKYLEFSCCSAVPGGGRNKEYALHLLNLTKGNIQEAIKSIINPNMTLPEYLRHYKYPEVDKWSQQQISMFQDALLHHGKDFEQIIKIVKEKSREECIMFYYLWKKVCSPEYESLKSKLKKREHDFTMELLKTVPPPPFVNSTKKTSPLPPLTKPSKKIGCMKKKGTANTLNEPVFHCVSIDDHNHVHDTEFPCKVCGKIFKKVKSRSAHMKSHRPEPSSPVSKGKPANGKAADVINSNQSNRRISVSSVHSDASNDSKGFHHLTTVNRSSTPQNEGLTSSSPTTFQHQGIIIPHSPSTSSTDVSNQRPISSNATNHNNNNNNNNIICISSSSGSIASSSVTGNGGNMHLLSASFPNGAFTFDDKSYESSSGLSSSFGSSATAAAAATNVLE